MSHFKKNSQKMENPMNYTQIYLKKQFVLISLLDPKQPSQSNKITLKKNYLYLTKLYKICSTWGKLTKKKRRPKIKTHADQTCASGKPRRIWCCTTRLPHRRNRRLNPKIHLDHIHLLIYPIILSMILFPSLTRYIITLFLLHKLPYYVAHQGSL